MVLKEPNMEISTKQANVDRFKDESLAAALAAENGIDGPAGGATDGAVVSQRPGYAKLEPKV